MNSTIAFLTTHCRCDEFDSVSERLKSEGWDIEETKKWEDLNTTHEMITIHAKRNNS